MPVTTADLALDQLIIDPAALTLACTYRLSVNGVMVNRGLSTASWSNGTMNTMATFISHVLTDVNAALKAKTIADQTTVKSGQTTTLATTAADLTTLKALGVGVIGVVT